MDSHGGPFPALHDAGGDLPRRLLLGLMALLLASPLSAQQQSPPLPHDTGGDTPDCGAFAGEQQNGGSPGPYSHSHRILAASSGGLFAFDVGPADP